MSLVRLQVIVVANPANTNALILKENAPKVKDENITCMTRLDHNRALGQVSPPYSLFLKSSKVPASIHQVGDSGPLQERRWARSARSPSIPGCVAAAGCFD